MNPETFVIGVALTGIGAGIIGWNARNYWAIIGFILLYIGLALH